MKTLAVRDQMEFAQRSISSMVEIVNILREDDDSRMACDLSLEAARTIKSAFDRLAWSDGNLSQEEIKQLHMMLEAHPWLWNSYLQVENSDPRQIGINNIPRLLFVTLDYDERMETQHAHRLVNAIEMIGYGVIAADGAASTSELVAFRDYVAALRKVITPEPPKGWAKFTQNL